MPAQAIKVTPSKAKDGTIDWKLCHKAPKKAEVCGDAIGSVINVGHNSGDNAGVQVLTVSINDVNKLGIKFSSDPLWIQANDKPKTHVIDASQIFDVKQPTPTKLVFKDRNDGSPVTLVYQLNFVGADQKPVTIDPEIKNGGTTIIGDNQIAYMLAGVALVILVAALVLSVRAIRSRAETNPGGGA